MVVLPIMWTFVGVVFLFVGLRLYTRIHLIDSLGSDDHAYTASSVRIITWTGFLPRAWNFFRHMPYNIADSCLCRSFS